MPTVALGKQVWDKNLSWNRALYRNNEFKKLPNKAISVISSLLCLN